MEAFNGRCWSSLSLSLCTVKGVDQPEAIVRKSAVANCSAAIAAAHGHLVTYQLQPHGGHPSFRAGGIARCFAPHPRLIKDSHSARLADLGCAQHHGQGAFDATSGHSPQGCMVIQRQPFAGSSVCSCRPRFAAGQRGRAPKKLKISGVPHSAPDVPSCGTSGPTP